MFIKKIPKTKLETVDPETAPVSMSDVPPPVDPKTLGDFLFLRIANDIKTNKEQ